MIVEMSQKQDKQKPKIHFFAGNPNVEVTHGIIHLFKNVDEESDNNSLASSSNSVNNNNNNNNNSSLRSSDKSETSCDTLPSQRSELICVLAVPTTMSPSDFAGFIGAYHKNITNMRILRQEGVQSRYMVLIKFNQQKLADNFYLEFNQKPFNSMEPETCNILFVSSAEFMKKSHDAVLKVPGQIELPTCPVCLDRLDEGTTGVIITQCNHSFHCKCLSKWKGENNCPVCRYTDIPDQSPVCSTCKSRDNLWICLICGNIGCGRNINEHALRHAKDSKHQFALELLTNRVWDYIGDGYVHRLLQSKDGKIVQYSGPSKQEQPTSEGDVSKLESISLEYSHLLETQRKYFDEQLRRLEREKMTKISHLEDEYAELIRRKDDAEKKQSFSDSERKKIEKKITTLETKCKDLLIQNKDLRDMNESLLINQKLWQEKLDNTEKKLNEQLSQKTKTVTDLEDQIKDLMFFIETKKHIESNSELQEAQIVGISPPAKTTTPTKKKRK